jgi:hypothetical protein
VATTEVELFVLHLDDGSHSALDVEDDGLSRVGFFRVYFAGESSDLGGYGGHVDHLVVYEDAVFGGDA